LAKAAGGATADTGQASNATSNAASSPPRSAASNAAIPAAMTATGTQHPAKNPAGAATESTPPADTRAASTGLSGPTLLVLCDLVCDWKLDGRSMGRIDAGGSAKEQVGPGKHSVFAVTEDGLDEIRRTVIAEKSGLLVVSLDLEPIRVSRLTATTLGIDEVLAELQERERFASIQAANPTWTDPTTGLTWRKHDSGSGSPWDQATAYCQMLPSSGANHWRLPTINELQSVYDPNNTSLTGPHARGNLQLSREVWSSSRLAERAWAFDFDHGVRKSELAQSSFAALCVRD